MDGRAVPRFVDPRRVRGVHQLDRHAGQRPGPAGVLTRPARSSRPTRRAARQRCTRCGPGCAPTVRTPSASPTNTSAHASDTSPCGAAKTSRASVASAPRGKSGRHPRRGRSKTASGDLISTRLSPRRSHNDDPGPSRSAGSTSTDPTWTRSASGPDPGSVLTPQPCHTTDPHAAGFTTPADTAADC